MGFALFAHERVKEGLHFAAFGLQPNPGQEADGQFARRAIEAVRFHAAGRPVCRQ